MTQSATFTVMTHAIAFGLGFLAAVLLCRWANK